MTCKEKLKSLHYLWDEDEIQKYIYDNCPCVADINIPDPSYCVGANPVRCTKCWDREIPGTEKMEEKTMATTKKTKAELLEELEQTQKTVDDLKKEIKNLEKYKVVRETADELKAFHTAFVDAGFTDAQAFKLLETFTASMLPSVVRGVKV